jgi:twitching motility two-component system response regulator PilG
MTKVLKALKDITQKKRSGKLIVRDPVDSSVIWEAYFGNGNIHFATSRLGQQERLTYLANYHHPDLTLNDLTIDRSDYQLICERWQSGQLSLQQARQLALTISQEALIHTIAIDDARLRFDDGCRLDTLILATSVEELVMPVKQLIWQWQEIRPQINSPFTRVYLSNVDSLYQLLWQELQSTKAIESYQIALTQNLCLYSIATQLNIDVLELSYLLRSLVHTRSVQISRYGQQLATERPTIAYIDGDRTMQNIMKLIMEAQGYKVIDLIKPAESIDRLMRTPPMLILLDITTPDFDGYECCQMLRRSPKLKNVPILMLGDRDNLLDRLKAKIVGANDYVTKPIIPKNLMNLVNKYISQMLVKS